MRAPRYMGLHRDYPAAKTYPKRVRWAMLYRRAQARRRIFLALMRDWLGEPV